MQNYLDDDDYNDWIIKEMGGGVDTEWRFAMRVCRRLMVVIAGIVIVFALYGP